MLTNYLIAIAVLGPLPIFAVLVIRAYNHERWQQELVTYELSFPRGLNLDAVTAFAASLSGLAVPWYRRAVVAQAVVFEVTAGVDGIRHHLVMPSPGAPTVLSLLRANLPGIGVRLDESHRLACSGRAVELRLNDHRRQLGLERAEALIQTMLTGLQPLDANERIIIQWSARPLGPMLTVTRNRPDDQTWWAHLFGTAHDAPDAEAVKALRLKHSQPLFACVGRIGVTAPSRAKARLLSGRVLAGLHLANAPGVHLRRRLLPSAMAASRLAKRTLPLITVPSILNAAELAVLVAFPVGDSAVPGLRLGGSRQLARSVDIPARGRVVAVSTFSGLERPLALSVADSLRHLHVVGPTGSGKSSLLLNLITHDMTAGRGVVVIDPKGDLVADVLDRVPESRLDDVCILDPIDDWPVGLNLLQSSEADRELITEHVVGTLHNLYRSNWGPRTDDVLRSTLLTLVGVPGMTLAEAPLLLTDAGFRRRLVGLLDEPIALEPFWAAYEAMTVAERAQVIGPVLNKLRAFLLRRPLRNVLGQAESRLDL